MRARGGGGENWGEFGRTWACSIVSVPAQSPLPNGLVDRKGDLAKLAYKKAQHMYKQWAPNSIFPKVAIARNFAPLFAPVLRP